MERHKEKDIRKDKKKKTKIKRETMIPFFRVNISIEKTFE